MTVTANGQVRRLIVTNFQSPGDVLMLTGAVRDLKLANPGGFEVDVRTSVPDLWMHNPYLAPLTEGQGDVETIQAHYPLV